MLHHGEEFHSAIAIKNEKLFTPTSTQRSSKVIPLPLRPNYKGSFARIHVNPKAHQHSVNKNSNKKLRFTLEEYVDPIS
jgi:hypothetical protein